MDIWQVMLLSPVMGLLAFGAFFGLMLAISYLYPLHSKLLLWAVVSTTCLSLVGTSVWWIVGAWRTSLKLLGADRVLQSTALFAVCLTASIGILREWLPDMVDGLDEAVEEVRLEAWVAAQRTEDSPWVVNAHPELRRLIASGPMGTGSAKALEAAILANPGLRLLELDSGGGWVSEEDRAIAIVRRHGLDTLVLNGCYSACTGVFLAGSTRYITPRSELGFHQSGYVGRPKNTQWDSPEYESSIFYREQGVSESFVMKAHSTSYYDMWYPQPLDMLQAGFANKWWSQREARYE